MKGIWDYVKGIDTVLIQRTDTCTVSGKVFFTQVVENTPIRPDVPESSQTGITQVYIFLTPKNENPVRVKTKIDPKGIVGIHPIFEKDTLPKIDTHFVGILTPDGTLLRYGEDMTQLYAHIPACDVQKALDEVQHISLAESGYEHFLMATTFSLAQREKLLNILGTLQDLPHAELQKLETMLTGMSPAPNPTMQYLVSTLSEFVDQSLYERQPLMSDEKNIDRLYEIKTHTVHLSRAENLFLSEMMHHFENLPSQYRPFIAEVVPQLLNLENLTTDQRDIAQALTMSAIKQYKDHPEAEKSPTIPTHTLVWNISSYPESVEHLVTPLQNVLSKYRIEIRVSETKQEHQVSPVLPYVSVGMGGIMILILLFGILLQQILKHRKRIFSWYCPPEI